MYLKDDIRRIYIYCNRVNKKKYKLLFIRVNFEFCENCKGEKENEIIKICQQQDQNVKILMCIQTFK